jgi:hypothetical protein
MRPTPAGYLYLAADLENESTAAAESGRGHPLTKEKPRPLCLAEGISVMFYVGFRNSTPTIGSLRQTTRHERRE